MLLISVIAAFALMTWFALQLAEVINFSPTLFNYTLFTPQSEPEDEPVSEQAETNAPGETIVGVPDAAAITDPQSNLIYKTSQEPFELPINGATGYTTVRTAMFVDNGEGGQSEVMLDEATPFLILGEEGDMWHIAVDGMIGQVAHLLCMINLPDVIPSIRYNITNSNYSEFRTSGVDIPGITGMALYNTRSYNERLGREEHVVPALYSMAKKIHHAQQLARENGETLVIFEAFRPYATQRLIDSSLTSLLDERPDLDANVNNGPWYTGWFISQSVSNHQRGCAIDVGLASVEMDLAASGDYAYYQIKSLTYYNMPTRIHELSVAAVAFAYPVSSTSKTAWIGTPFSTGMASNPEAIKLFNYCIEAGLSPLASEWWHFNDLDARAHVPSHSRGDFVLAVSLSVPPYTYPSQFNNRNGS